MATTQCRMRLLTDKERDLTMRLKGLEAFSHKKNGLSILSLTAKITTPSDSATEIAAPTTVFDGVDAPAKVGVRSTSANDTDSAAGHAREATLLGFGTGTTDSGDVEIQTEVVALNGVSVVLTTKYWTRILHFKATKFGTGGADCAGILQIVDPTETTAVAEITNITATNSLLNADEDYFTFYDIDEDSCLETRYNVYLNKSGGGSAPTLDGTEIEVDISGTEDAQVCTIVAKAPGVPEVSTITAKAPGVAEIATVVAKAPGAAEVSTITCTAPGAAEVSTIVAKDFGTAEISTVVAKAFGTAEITTVVADTFANLVDGSYFTLSGVSATYGVTDYYVWFDKVGDSSGKPTVAGTEIEIDISGDTTAQDVSDTLTSVIDALGDFGAANGGGASTTVTITQARKGAVTDAVDVDSGLVITVTTPGVTNIPNGGYFELYGIDASFDEIGYYVWFDKVGDDAADPAPGGGLTGVDCNISAATTDQDISDIIVTMIDALDAFGAANGGGTLPTVTITNALKGSTTNIVDGDSTLTLATTTPGVTNMPDGSYIVINSITDATKVENPWYIWFDKVGDTSGDPAPALHEEIYVDISADVSAQDISDAITAAVDAKPEFGATNAGGTSTTVTITNAYIGAVTDIADTGSTGLTVATTTPGTNLIADGSYITFKTIVAATKAEKGYYLWFDWIGDTSGDPAPASHTEVRIDMSAMTTVKEVADAITVAVDALTECGCTDDDTTCTITNAVIGAATNIADVGTNMAVAVDTPGTNVIVDGTYFTFEAINPTTKDPVKYFVWFDWIGDESGVPTVAGYTKITCDISADVTAQNVSDCIAAAIDAKDEVGAANSAGLTTTITHTTQGAVNNIADGDSGLTLATTTPGVTNIADGSYIVLYAITDATKVENKYFLWFDWVGDSSALPTPGGTEIRIDMSSLTTVKNVADAITVAIDALDEFGCTDDDTTCTITNAFIGAVTNIADTGSTGLSVAVDTPGTNVIVDGTYLTLSAINGSGVQVDYYLWFDWIGDSSGDPAPADKTEIRIDMSSMTSIKNVADGITTVVHAIANFTCTDNDTTCTITNANAGDCANIADVDTNLTVDTTTEGGSTATEVATAIVTAINNSAANVTAAADTYPKLKITNKDKGAVTDAADGLTTKATDYTIATKTQGAGASTCYLLIASGSIESNGSRIYIPDGYFSKIEHLMIYPTSDLSTNGTKIRINKKAFFDETNTDDDLGIDSYLINDLEPSMEICCDNFPVLTGTNEAYYKFEELKQTTAVGTRLKVIVFIMK